MVDAVGNIDPKDLHKELVHEAMEVIDEVKTTLADLLLKQIDAERLKEEATAAEKLAKDAIEKTERIQKEADDKAEEIRLETEARENEAEKQREITERINKLRMIPMDVMGEPSKVIKKKIASINNVKIDADSFSTHVDEATQARDKVLEQLTGMLEQVEQIEALTPATKPATVNEQASAEVAVDTGSAPDTTVTANVKNNKITEVRKQEPVTLRGDVTAWANKFLTGPNGEYAFEQLMNVLTNHQQ